MALHPVSKKPFGTALFSPWPIKNDRKVLLPHAARDKLYRIQRSATCAEVAAGTRDVTACSVHLGVLLTAQQRSDQVNALFEALPSDVQRSVIAGDFNSFTGGQAKTVAAAMRKGGFDWASKDAGWTYSFWFLLNKRATLDHIYTKGFTVLTSGKISSAAASDHQLLWAYLEDTVHN
jgi:endonuclease/exonuclease/phosphatase family metal-dependent hydrolase